MDLDVEATAMVAVAVVVVGGLLRRRPRSDRVIGKKEGAQKGDSEKRFTCLVPGLGLSYVSQRFGASVEAAAGGRRGVREG